MFFQNVFYLKIHQITIFLKKICLILIHQNDKKYKKIILNKKNQNVMKHLLEHSSKRNEPSRNWKYSTFINMYMCSAASTDDEKLGYVGSENVGF